MCIRDSGYIVLCRLPLATPHARTHVVRGIAGFVSLVMYFHAISLIPLAAAVTLNYTSPLFLALLLALWLKEPVRRGFYAAQTFADLPARDGRRMTMEQRVGIGYDSHRFGSGGPMRLGGIDIPASMHCAGHSDGDAICHAVTDALLGAAALGDIGEMFPDTDPAPAACPEHLAYVIYTSGSTGKPKGVLHTSGGYLVYAALTHEAVFDLREDDVYWCTADVGCVTGHSYVVYGPLANGATSLMFEGVPSYPGPDRFWQVCDKHKVTICLLYTSPSPRD